MIVKFILSGLCMVSSLLAMESPQLPPEILKEVVQVLEQHFKTEIRIDSVKVLSEPERRNVIARITLSNPKVPKTVIFKQSLPEELDAKDKEAKEQQDRKAFERFASDWAGLEFLSGLDEKAHDVPKFYGGSKEHRFILIEDLGEKHISLVDTLTLPDRQKATLVLERFVKALGRMHATSFGHTEKYHALYKSINPDAKPATAKDILETLMPKIQKAHELFSLSMTPELKKEIDEVVASMTEPGPFTVLTHGDICPDNVFDHPPHDLQLIDFEWASIGYALRDAVYLRMSMPTCWCAKAIPGEVISHLEMLYREELKKTIPEAKNDETYTTAYTHGCAFWMVQSMMFLEGIWDKEDLCDSGPVPEESLWKPEMNKGRPRFLSRLQSFIDVASEHKKLPHLCKMAEEMLCLAKKRWPDAKLLEVYPAFTS